MKKFAKKKHTRYLPMLFFIFGTLVVILTVYTFTTQWTHYRSRAAETTGWLSGSACIDAANGGFGVWRGSPMTIAGTWNDRDVASQKAQWSLGNEYKDWNQSLDVAVGGFWDSNWATAANGGHDVNLRAALQAINANWGSKKTVFIRYAHEFNGSWFQWKVAPSDNENFKKASARFYQLVQEELVAKGRDAKVAWSPNSDEHNGQNTALSWPGDQYVDVVAVDFYDWDYMKDQETWDKNFNKTGKSGGPAGVGSWQAFAKSHGKPLAFSEWGTSGEGPKEDPFFIKKMNEFFRANAGTGPGQVWYEVYFNCGGEDWKNKENGKQIFQIYPEADVPQTSAMYKSLKWGDGGVASPTKGAGIITPPFVCGGSQYCIPSANPSPNSQTPNITTQPVNQNFVINPETPNGSNENQQEETNQKNNNQDKAIGNNGNKNKGGFFDWLFALFALFVSLLMKLFGR